MDTRNSARIVYESDTVTYLRRGSLDILDAVAVQLPDVFIGEILPKLSLKDTLHLAQVSKAYRDSVWNVGGVQSMEAKLDAHKAHLVKTGKIAQVLDTAPHPMYYAAKHGNLRAVRAFLQSGVDVNMTVSLPLKDDPGKTYSNITPLFMAVEQGHTPCVMELIKAGADVNIARSDGFTPLCMAAQCGNEGCVVSLIQAGADVNIARSDGFTPLCTATLNGNVACVASLIQAGADIHKAADNGCTPLSVAVYYKHEKIAALLRHFGGAR